MLAQWMGDLVGKMHINRITNVDMALKLGYTTSYVSMVLNGKKCPKNAELRFNQAADELIAEKEMH